MLIPIIKNSSKNSNTDTNKNNKEAACRPGGLGLLYRTTRAMGASTWPSADQMRMSSAMGSPHSSWVFVEGLGLGVQS